MLSLQKEVSYRDLAVEFPPAYQAWFLNEKRTGTMEKRKRSRGYLAHALIKLAVCVSELVFLFCV